MVVGAGLGAGGADAPVFQKEDGAWALTDHVYPGLLPAVVGEHPAEEVLGAEALQNRPGAVVLIADYTGGAGSDNSQIPEAGVIAADGLPGFEFFFSGLQA